MKLRYVGPADAVIVPLPSGIEVLCPRGEDRDFPDEHAKSLLEQDIWQKATTRKEAS